MPAAGAAAALQPGTAAIGIVLALVFLPVFLAALLGLGLVRLAAVGPFAARHPVGPFHRVLALGLAAMGALLLLDLAALAEIFFLVFGFLHLGRTLGVIDVRLRIALLLRRAAFLVLRPAVRHAPAFVLHPVHSVIPLP